MFERLSPESFGTLFSTFEVDAFRVETLDLYRVPNEEPGFERFLAGHGQVEQTNAKWCELIRARLALGRHMSRIHAVSVPLTPYLRFEIAAGYVHSQAAGERISLADRARVSADLLQAGDFWLFDSRRVVQMSYDDDGRFLFGSLTQDPEFLRRCLQIRDRLQGLAEPLDEFLARS